MEFTIMVNGKDIAVVGGLEVAFEVYAKAKELAECVGGSCDLVDNSTGEVIAWWDFEEGEGF